ncbi:hypothetical protein SI65_01667 [Aspergillus cristatus]|uniref:HTH CENPB-type domain-containing protein n=1 Tax=Aspergillus cristatus TaxID=573508 RepID=A0A1E3BT71_ASPCR|nr:hypothetical protein SI65_01667 [Aspergillus cristatus]
MPPKSRNSIEKEGRIQLAISALNKSQISTVRGAARHFQVPESTLRTRLHGITPRAEKRANNHKLTVNEEESLLHWILSMDRRGAAPRPSHVQDMANILLAARGSTNNQPIGKNWVSNFIKRHDEHKTSYSRRYNYQRAKCEDPRIIKEWFDLVQITMMQHGIAYEDVYNFDETGYAMGLIATAKVVTRADMYGRRQVIQPGNREWVTSIECVNSMGWVLPPCIIFKGSVHIEGWYQDSKLPHNWRIEVSPNGWTSDQIGLRWLQKVFIPETTSRTTGKYRLLVLDGHGSHLTPEFDKICSENDIIPICMPPHSSNYCQPLDVSCFSPLKGAYGCLVQDRMRKGFNHMDKLDFLEAYPEARKQAFTLDNIKSGFRATGLVPFNPEEVLGRFTIQLETPTPPGSQSINSAPKTPYNLRQLEKQASTVKTLLKGHTQNPPSVLEMRLDKIIKGHEMALNEAILARQEIHELRASHEKQLQKRKRSRRQIATEEGLSIQEGQDLIQGRSQEEEVMPTTSMEPAPMAEYRSVRAPPRCSDCNTSGHKRTHCPNRNSN